MRKRILPLFLTLCLCLNLAPATLAAEGESDFVIEDGVLTEYTGPGGHVVIPDEVVSIGEGAFWKKNELITAVTIPDSVTTLEASGVFDLCTSLTRVELGAGLSELPPETFQLCTSLEEIVIPANITSIGDNAFEGCSSLTKVTIYGTDTQISNRSYYCAFHNCSPELTVSFPDRTSDGDIPSIFINPPNSKARVLLGDGTIPSDFTIQDGVASKYTGPGGHVIIPSNVTAIDSHTFRDCTALTGVTIPDGVTSIGASAFSGCTGLKRVVIPDSVTTIEDKAFDAGTQVVDRNGVSLAGFVIREGDMVGYTGPGGAITIPGNFVKRITRDAFHGFYSTPNCDITSLTVTEGTTEIGEESFYFCKTLTRVTLPDSVTTIGQRAFAYCDTLERADLGRGIRTVAAEAFHSCPALTQVSLPDSASVDGTAFLNSPNVQGIGNNQSFNENTFIMDGTVLIRYTGLGGHVVIPDGVTAIGMYDNGQQETMWHYNGAFENCAAVTGITIPSSVKTIADNAFNGCTGLTSITIPDSVTEIDCSYLPYNGFLSGCTSLRTVVFGDGLTAIPALKSLPALERVTLPARLTALPDACFNNCPNLTHADIPSTVTTIGNNAFIDSGITSLVIPEGVKSCGDFFSWETTLRELTLPSTLESRPALTCPGLRKLTLPRDCWAFMGMSRADFMKYISKCPKLQEIVNCPNEFVDDLIASNAALRDNWLDPSSTIVPQSARITALSNQITAGLTDDYDKAKAISQWVIDHIKYDDDYYYAGLKDYSDVPFDPEEILDKGQAVCAGISRLTQALMVAQKIPCLYVLGSAGGSHAWNLALIDGEYLWIDNTWGMDYFALGIYAISTDHQATGAASFNNVKGPGTLVNGAAGGTAVGSVPSDWAQAEVEAAIAAGLVPAALQDAYTALITRQEFCTLMVKLVEQSSGQSIDDCLAARGLARTSPFTDTSDGDILAAYALGIVKGTSDTTFYPTGSITRQEAATMLARTAALLSLTGGSAEVFSDAAQIADWAGEAVALVSGLTDPTSGNKVMGGTGEGRFSPLATYSREQAILTSLRLFHCTQQ